MNEEELDKAAVFDAFVFNCNEKLSERYHGIKAAVWTFATTLLITTLALAMGFCIGLALGAWIGPAAFFTALALGEASAAYVAIETSLIGIATLAYSGYSFFSKPVKGIVDEFVEAVWDQPPNVCL